jgi:sialate O-acetylesterase
MMMKKAVVFLLFFHFLWLSSKAEVKLPRLISDGIVLQRDTKVRVWGWADPGETVTITLQKKKFAAKANSTGEWQVMLPPQKAGGPYEMVFKGKNEIKISSVLFGDVWVCAGQSNMVIPMERVKEKYPDEIAAADYPEIRNFFIPTLTNLEKPSADLPSGEWKSANPKDILGFSAVAYFFAKKIYEKYHIPIGIINSSVGGTPVEAWISENGYKKLPDFQKVISRNKNTAYIDSLMNSRPKPVQKEVEDKGLIESPKWYENSYVPKGWHNINIPGYWEDQGIKDLNGVVWYRREIEVPQSMIGMPVKLFLGRIVDADFAYVNGQQVGNITYQYPPRRYEIPSGVLKPGKNILVVRVINTGGKGGFVPDKPYFMTANGQNIDLKGTWKYKVGEVYEPVGFSGFGFSAQNQPTALYNAMIAPIKNQTIKGFLWYQGESNADRPRLYKKLLPELISDWRTQWGEGELPFFFVQLANFMDVNYLPVESNWAELRDAQLQALSVPNTAMAVAIDLGEWNDIHPLNKKDLGERLALCAQNLAYGEMNLEYMGPIYQSAKVDGNKIVVNFTHTGSGLISSDGEPLNRFEIAGADHKFVWASARIVGTSIEIWNQTISEPKFVRYAWSDNPDGANLYNREGLPASPFRTDQ